MRSWRVRVLALLVVTISLTVAGCARTGDPPGTLSVMDYYTDGASSDTISEILDMCGEQVGVTIERQSMPRDQLISQALRQAAARDLPGMLMLDNPDLQQIAETGALNPLDDLGVSTDGYFDSIVSAGTYEDETYALALGVNALALIYNTDHFAEAGVEPPRTWDELIQVSNELRQDRNYGIGFAAPATEEGTWQFQPFLWSNGAELTELDGAQAKESLELWVDLVEDGHTSRSVVNWEQSDVIDQFAGGHVPMMINGSWAFATLDEYEELNYDIAPLPVPDEEDTLQVPLGGEVWSIPRTDPETEENATQVLSCMLEEDNMLTWAEGNTVVPTRAKTAETYAESHPRMRTFVEAIETARARTEELGSRYPEVSQAVWTAIQEALVGAKPPDVALQDAQGSVKEAEEAEGP